MAIAFKILFVLRVNFMKQLWAILRMCSSGVSCSRRVMVASCTFLIEPHIYIYIFIYLFIYLSIYLFIYDLIRNSKYSSCTYIITVLVGSLL